MTVGLSKMTSAISKIVPSSIGFKKRLGISAAAIAPPMPPITVGMRIGITAGRSRVSCLSYPASPTKHCMVTATRLVALAISAGRPNTISAGRARLEPPPATVLMPPAKNPVMPSRRTELRVISKIIPSVAQTAEST